MNANGEDAFDAMSLREQAEYMAALQRRHHEREDALRCELVEDIRRRCAELSWPVEECAAALGAGASAAKPGGKLPVKYRSPDGRHTWSGRGKLPTWLAAAVAAGHGREEFAVQTG